MVLLIAPHLIGDGISAAHGEIFRGVAMPSLLLPFAIDADACAALRARLADAGTEPFWIADRGRYRHNGDFRIDELWTELRALAVAIVGASLEVIGGRWQIFSHGDYALVRDDAHTRPAGRHLELLLDVSAAASGEAEVMYSDGTSVLAVPQWPGMLALIDRPPAVSRFERPVTVRSNGLDVVRLRLSLV